MPIVVSTEVLVHNRIRSHFRELLRTHKSQFIAIRAQLESTRGHPPRVSRTASGRQIVSFQDTFAVFIVRDRPLTLWGIPLPFFARRHIVITRLFTVGRI